MSPVNKLRHLWFAAKSQDNCLDYIEELLTQVKLFGCESNKLTREHILVELDFLVASIRRSLQ